MAAKDKLITLLSLQGLAQYQAGMRQAIGIQDQFGDAERRRAAAMRTAGMALTVVGAATIGIAATSIRAINQQIEAELKLRNAISSTGMAINPATLIAQANALQELTRFSDDETIEAQAMLATMRLTEDQILKLTPVIQDLAQMYGVELHQAAIQVGKAISTNNYGMLQRYGIIIDEAVKKSGDFNLILRELQKNASGTAEAFGKTAAGKMAIFKNEVNELQEAIGRALLPALTDLANTMTPVIEKFAAFAQTGIGQVAAKAAIGLGLLAAVAGPLLILAASFRVLAEAVKLFKWALVFPPWAKVVAGIGLAVMVEEAIRRAKKAKRDIDELTRQSRVQLSTGGAVPGAATGAATGGRQWGPQAPGAMMDVATIMPLLPHQAKAAVDAAARSEGDIWSRLARRVIGGGPEHEAAISPLAAFKATGMMPWTQPKKIAVIELKLSKDIEGRITKNSTDMAFEFVRQAVSG